MARSGRGFWRPRSGTRDDETLKMSSWKRGARPRTTVQPRQAAAGRQGTGTAPYHHGDGGEPGPCLGDETSPLRDSNALTGRNPAADHPSPNYIRKGGRFTDKIFSRWVSHPPDEGSLHESRRRTGSPR